MNNETNEELAIITSVGFGVRDMSYVGLFFTVDMLNGSALLILSAEEGVKLLDKHRIYSVEQLKGEPCIVRTVITEGRAGGRVEFVDLK